MPSSFFFIFAIFSYSLIEKRKGYMIMIKVFISVGMRGRANEDVEEDIRRANHWIYQNIYCNTTQDVQAIDNWDCQGPENAGRLWYLGEAIKKLGECDICYFVKGWQNHKGCIAEMEICKLYGIEVIEES